jgi:gamma-glutamyltranspeptidase/glutathione hydrolase
MKRKPVIIAFICLSISCNQGTTTDNIQFLEGKHITASNGMVVSAHPQGSRAGIMILQQGGNAVDAAVATGFALAVCYPAAGNIGGGGFMLLRTSGGEYDLIDFREKAPLGSSKDMYLDSAGNVNGILSTDTHLAAGVPGSVDGLIRVHQKYGRLKFSKVIQPAIDLAIKGFILTPEQAEGLNWNSGIFKSRNPSGCAFVRESGWKAGDTLVQPDLAATLERIRDHGREGFYSGRTAELIVSEMKRGNGIISAADLEQYSSEFRKPLSSGYRNYTIVTCPPPSAGGIILLQLFAMVENFPLGAFGFRSSEMVHLIAEAERRAFADRAEYAGDADFIRVPVKGLLNREYLTGRMSDFNKRKASLSSDISAGLPGNYESTETTHYSVVDREGNAVSTTTTLNGGYGSSIVVAGAGFLLNNEMDDFSARPGFPNMYGLTGSDANAIEPGKRMLSSMTPVIAEKDGKLLLVAGSPGGSTIPTTVFQVLINVIDYNMDIWQAVDTGRFHHQWLPDMITIERNRLDSSAMAELKMMGHELRLTGGLGRVNAVSILNDGKLAGAADRRGDNSACGY